MERGGRNRKAAAKPPQKPAAVVDDSTYKQVLIAGRSRSSSMQSETALVAEQSKSDIGVRSTMAQASCALERSSAKEGEVAHTGGRPPLANAADDGAQPAGHRRASTSSLGSTSCTRSVPEHPDLQPAARHAGATPVPQGGVHGSHSTRSSTQEEADFLRSELQKAQQQLVTARSELSQGLSAAIKAREDGIQAAQAEARTQVEAIQQRWEAAEHELRVCREAKETAEARVDELQTSLNESNSQRPPGKAASLCGQAGQAAQAQAQAIEGGHTVPLLHAKLAQLEQEAALRQQELQKLQRMYSASDMSRKMLQSVHNDLCKEHGETEETLRRAGEANAGLAQALDQARLDLKHTTDRVTELEFLLAEQQQLYRRDINRAHDDLVALEQSFCARESQGMAASRMQQQEGERTVGSLQQQLDSWQQRCAILESELRSSRALSSGGPPEVEEQCNSLKAALEEARLGAAASEAVLAEARAALQEAEARCRLSEEGKVRALADARAATEELSLLRRRLKNIEDEHRQMSAQVSEYREELQLVSGKWSAAAAEAQSLQVAFLRSRDQQQIHAEEYEVQRKAAVQQAEQTLQLRERMFVNELSIAKAAHASSLSSMEQELASQRAIAAQGVAREEKYKQQVEELKGRLDAARGAVETAVATSREGKKATAALEAQIAAVTAERDSLRSQVRDSIVARQAVEEEVAKLQAALSTARSTSGAEITELRRQFAETTQRHEETLRTLRSQHEVDVLQVGKGAMHEHAQALEALKAGWSKAEARYKQQLSELQTALDSDRAAHGAAFTALKQEHEREQAQTLERYVRRDQELASALAGSEAVAQVRLDAVRVEHAAALASLRAEHSAAMAGLQGEAATARVGLEKALARVQTMQAEKDAAQSRWQVREQQLCAELAEADTSLTALQAELSRVRDGVQETVRQACIAAEASASKQKQELEGRLSTALEHLAGAKLAAAAAVESERRLVEDRWVSEVSDLQEQLRLARAETADKDKLTKLLSMQAETLKVRVHDLESLLLEAVARRDAIADTMQQREQVHERELVELKQRHHEELHESGVRGMALLRQHWEESGLQKAKLQASVDELGTALASAQQRVGEVTSALQACREEKLQLQTDIENTQAALTALVSRQVGDGTCAASTLARSTGEDASLASAAADLVEVVRELKEELHGYMADTSSPAVRETQVAANLEGAFVHAGYEAERAGSEQGGSLPVTTLHKPYIMAAHAPDRRTALSPVAHVLSPPVPPLPASASVRAWRKAQRSPHRPDASFRSAAARGSEPLPSSPR